jgi:hypothetical protein
MRGCDRMVIGEEGLPHGVVSDGWVSGRRATASNPGSSERPVPPIMAICTGPLQVSLQHHGSGLVRMYAFERFREV